VTITVYLDSSDYSNLSANPNYADLREKLMGIAKTPKVRFVYSGVIICEMAPTEPGYTASAAGRADVLMAFCRRNALPSIDRLLEREFDALRHKTANSGDLIDGNGNWFPDVGQLASPSQALETARIVSEEISSKAKNRQQRRAAKSLTLRKGRLRSSAVSQLQNGDLSAILEMYPMRPQDARVIEHYVLGLATAAEADNALLESMRDPGWMMRWFEKHHDKLGPVTQWVRDPSDRLLRLVQDFAEKISDWMQSGSYASDFAKQITKPDHWLMEQNKLLLTVANRLIAEPKPTALSIESINEFCPGFATWIRSTHESMRLALLAKHPRKPKKSDFVDSLHAAYAPYVDIFRADDYMTPILRPLVQRYGTTVCGKLAELPNAIANYQE
jgi:hypothetical protein